METKDHEPSQALLKREQRRFNQNCRSLDLSENLENCYEEDKYLTDADFGLSDCSHCRKRKEAEEQHDKSPQNKPADSQYPALEGGWAWVIVAASFCTHMLTRGILFATGILFSTWVVYFDQTSSNTAWIGSIATGSALLLGPLSAWSNSRWGYRTTCMFGGFVAACGFLISSFAGSIFYLYVSYGIITGAGLGFCYMSAVIAVGEYFNERRSLAFGMAAGGSGCGTIVMAILQQYLLDLYNWQGAMVVLAGLSGLHLVLCGVIMRPLSSPLNWKTRAAKLRLLQHQSSDIGCLFDSNPEKMDTVDAKEAPHSKTDEKKLLEIPKITEERVENEKNKFKSESSSDSGFSGKDSDNKDTETDSTNELSTADEEDVRLIDGSNVEKRECENTQAQIARSPVHNYLKVERPKSQIVTSTCTSPALLLRAKFLEKSQHDINCNNGLNTSVASLNSKRMRSPAERKTQQVKNRNSSSECRTPKITYSHCQSNRTINYAGTNASLNIATPSKQKLHIKSGDAMYISSLSLASARSVSRNIIKSNIRDQMRESYTACGSISRLQSTAATPYQKSHCSSHQSYWDIGSIAHYDYCPECDIPIPRMEINENKSRRSVLRNPLFLILAINQFFTYLGVLVPYVHLTEKAKLMGVNATKAATLVSFIGAGNIIGKISLGIMCDLKCCNRFLIFFLTQLGMGLITLFIPIFNTYETMIIFSLVFGFCFGNYAAFPSLMAEYVGLESLSEAMGYIVFLEGAAAIIGPPIAGAIYDFTASYNNAFLFAGGILLFSWVLLFLQPIFYESVTGTPSSVRQKISSCSKHAVKSSPN